MWLLTMSPILRDGYEVLSHITWEFQIFNVDVSNFMHFFEMCYCYRRKVRHHLVRDTPSHTRFAVDVVNHHSTYKRKLVHHAAIQAQKCDNIIGA